MTDIDNAKTKALEILNEKMMLIAEEIRINHENAGQVASGHMKDSLLSSCLHDNEIYIGYVEAADYIESLEKGNAPWDDVPDKLPSDFVEKIGNWMEAKGISESGAMNRYSMSWKIIREGSKLYREGGRNDIYSNVVEKYGNEIADEVLKEYDYLIQKIATNK